MDAHDVPRWIGEDHLAVDDLPAELLPLVDEALARGLIFQDCRDQLACL
ncbi:hypothetical protein ACFQ0K_02445 [Nocardioides caeni]|nr:hypothetical protein [Nocardioides caeni]